MSWSRLRSPAEVRFLTAFANCPSWASCKTFLLISRARGVASWVVFLGAWDVLMGRAELSASLKRFSQSPLRALVRIEESHSPARNALFLDFLLFLGGSLNSSFGRAKRRIHFASLSGLAVMAFIALYKVSPQALLQLLGQCLSVGTGLVMTQLQSRPGGRVFGMGSSALAPGFGPWALAWGCSGHLASDRPALCLVGDTGRVSKMMSVSMSMGRSDGALTLRSSPPRDECLLLPPRGLDRVSLC